MAPLTSRYLYFLGGEKWWEEIRPFSFLLHPGQCWDTWEQQRDKDLFLQQHFREPYPLYLVLQSLFTIQFQLNFYSTIAVWERKISLKGRCCGDWSFLEEFFAGQHFATVAAAATAHLPSGEVVRRGWCSCSLAWRLSKVRKNETSPSDLALQILSLQHVSGLQLKQAKLHWAGASTVNVLAVDYRVMQWEKQS